MFFVRDKKKAVCSPPPEQKTSIDQAIDRLKDGDLSVLRIVYTVLATEDRTAIRQAGEAVCEQLSRLTRTGLLKLCERFRDSTSLEWFVDWSRVSPERLEKALSKGAYRHVLILGAFHPNGYYRERCVRAMAGLPGMLYWLLPRVNDWVPQVRLEAENVLGPYLLSCDGAELIDALPAFDRLRDGRRRTSGQMERLEEQVRERLSQALAEMGVGGVAGRPPAVRASLYRMAAGAGLWTMEQMEACLEREKQSCLKRILLRQIFAHPDCTVEWAEHYLKDPSSVVRRMAVESRYGRLKDSWPGLEEMLADSSKGVRGYAAYILKRHGSLDIRGYYLDHLTEDGRGYAILGLSEYSRQGNVQSFLGCLEAQESQEHQKRQEGQERQEVQTRRILRAVLLALGTQEDFSDVEFLWRYLADERVDIAKAAYLSIRKLDIPLGAERVYQAYMEAELAHQKRYLLSLLLKENSWERLPCLLGLYHVDMPEREREQVLSGICCRSMYGKVTKPLQQAIVSALEQKREELPAGVEKGILYDMRVLVR